MVSAVIVAAGKGTRMGPNVDKLFLELQGRPVVAHTWATFEAANCVDEIILVVREGLQDQFESLAAAYGFRKPFKLIAGGKERQDSVWNGLEAVSPACEVVAIQDAARPCTTHALVEETVRGAREVGAAVAAQPVVDTIKESSNGRLAERTLDRSKLWAVQTPQTFRLEVIRRALSEVRSKGMLVTDDTAACELIGQEVLLVSSADPNPKVTRTEDLDYVDLLLKKRGIQARASRG